MQSINHLGSTIVTKRVGSLATSANHNTVPRAYSQIDLIGTDVAFPRNSQFYEEGDRAVYLYKIASGVARTCTMMDDDGRRQIVAFYVPGDLFGFESGDTHTLSAEAVTDSRVRVIKRASIVDLADRNGDLARQLWLSIGREIEHNQQHILQFGKPARARVASFLLEMLRRIPRADAVALSISRQDIADYLDLRIETVSRAMTRFAKSGAISLSRTRKITIRNPSLLRQAMH
jgi:CRP/FNR family transcriptional regulator, nitrogen fixation regulation protein